MTHLKKLCSLEGVSGREHPVREYILRVLQQRPADMFGPFCHADILSHSFAKFTLLNFNKVV